jgi:hypothetical protein
MIIKRKPIAVTLTILFITYLLIHDYNKCNCKIEPKRSETNITLTIQNISVNPESVELTDPLTVQLVLGRAIPNFNQTIKSDGVTRVLLFSGGR